MNSAIIKTLEEKHINPTPMRMLVLEQLAVNQKNLSLSDLEELLYPSDRITIYRTLQTFVKHGLVHAIETSKSGAIYALCNEKCKIDAHLDHHPHFICEKCKRVICSNDFSFKMEYLPASKNYIVEKIEVIVKGICPDCNNS
jgi:Fur family transcriptional regulator, ferric uptake regulator